MQIGGMRSSLTIPDDLLNEINRLAETLKEPKATILRKALGYGLPKVGQDAPMPYDPHMYDGVENMDERIALEEATAKSWGGPDGDRE